MGPVSDFAPVTFLQMSEDGTQHKLWCISRPPRIAEMAAMCEAAGARLRFSMEGPLRKLSVYLTSPSLPKAPPWPEALWADNDRTAAMVDIFVEAVHQRLLWSPL